MANNITEGGGFLEVSAQREGVNSVTRRRIEAPPTPGRPVFSFSAGNHPRKSFPSKWDDAEKWLMSSSCHDSPAHTTKSSESSKIIKQADSVKQQVAVFAEKSRVTEENVSKVVSTFQGSASLDQHYYSVRALHEVSASTDVLLKGKDLRFDFNMELLPFRFTCQFIPFKLLISVFEKKKLIVLQKLNLILDFCLTV